MILLMFMMVLLATSVGFYAFITRIVSVKSGAVDPRKYKLMDGDFPEKVLQTTRCFNNQFEIPILFYVGALAYLFTGHGSNSTGIVIASLFVASRYLHAWIHITYNHLMHRLIVFWSGIALVLGFWINLLVLTYAA